VLWLLPLPGKVLGSLDCLCIVLRRSVPELGCAAQDLSIGCTGCTDPSTSYCCSLARNVYMLLLLLLQGLKATGSYLARTLSYHGAEFTLADVQLSPHMRCVQRRSKQCTFKPCTYVMIVPIVWLLDVFSPGHHCKLA
jgi:hypothetical protein